MQEAISLFYHPRKYAFWAQNAKSNRDSAVAADNQVLDIMDKYVLLYILAISTSWKHGISMTVSA